MTFQADIILEHEGIRRLNARRVGLLEAVGRTGSIAAAAREMGLSYKASWDALDEMQRLTPKPLLQKLVGGRSGGGTQITNAGLRLIEIWHKLQSGLAELVNQLQNDFDAIDLDTPQFLQGFMMRTSARNVFYGHVAEITPSNANSNSAHALLADVRLDLGNNLFIHSSITHSSVARLGLTQHRQAHALVKASFVHLTPLEQFLKSGNRFSDKNCVKNKELEHLVEPSETKNALEKTSASTTSKNCLCGTICNIDADDHHTEITVDLGRSSNITSTCDKSQTEQLVYGMAVVAQFNPADVILATR